MYFHLEFYKISPCFFQQSGCQWIQTVAGSRVSPRSPCSCTYADKIAAYAYTLCSTAPGLVGICRCHGQKRWRKSSYRASMLCIGLPPLRSRFCREVPFSGLFPASRRNPIAGTLVVPLLFHDLLYTLLSLPLCLECYNRP